VSSMMEWRGMAEVYFRTAGPLPGR
jgi:hypothetical protein